MNKKNLKLTFISKFNNLASLILQRSSILLQKQTLKIYEQELENLLMNA